jgi:hypothetical protein
MWWVMQAYVAAAGEGSARVWACGAVTIVFKPFSSRRRRTFFGNLGDLVHGASS